MRKQGHAVIVWTPDELGESISVDQMEDACIQAGNRVLDDAGEFCSCG